MTRKTLIRVAVTLAALLLLLIWFVWAGRANKFDLPLREALLAFDPPNAVDIWRGITFLGSGLVITALTVVCVIIFAARAEWQAARQIIYVMAGAVGVENGLKWIVHRARPDEVFPHTMPSSYSFPSGHALFAMAFYISVAMIVGHRLNDKARTALWVAAVSLVILIGASRIFLGVHYPSDVMGSYIAAGLWIVLLQLPFGKYSSAHQ